MTIERLGISLLEYCPIFLVKLVELLTTEDYYKKDLTFLIDLEEEIT